MEEGIFPVRLLKDRDRIRNGEMGEKGGIDPEKLFPSKSMISRDGLLKREGGTSPSRSLLPKSSHPSDELFAKRGGMPPVRLLFARTTK